jgi:hypothetical protein
MALLWMQVQVLHVRELSPTSLTCSPGRLQRSHNNVDLVRFRERYFLALRTAPSHFPSRRAELRILASPDLETWSCDTVLQFGCDVREPRWLVWRDSLYLYFFLGGKSPWRFEAQAIQGVVYREPKQWDPFSIGWTGWVPWRARATDTVAYLSISV